MIALPPIQGRDWSRVGIACAVVVALSFIATPVQADLVKLLNGGELRGRITGGTATSRLNAESIMIETLSGVVVSVARTDMKFLTMRPVVVEEYETRARRISDTLQAHWELSEWCRQQSLSKQREHHLLRVAELDPHHEKAQTALGRVWHEGAWVDRDDMMAERGYVKHKGRYITLQELDLIQKTADELAIERDWFQKVKGWHVWITGRHEERYRQGLTALQQIEDPHAAPAIIRFLCEDKNRDIRSLGVAALSKLTGSKGAAGLVKLSLYDPEDDVRYASLNGIHEEDYEFAQTAFIRELRNSLNVVVCRAGMGLARVGDQRAVAPLIEALVTTHKYQVQSNIPAVQSYSGSTDGSSGGGGSGLPPEVEMAIRTGQLPQGAVMGPQVGGIQVPRKMVTVSVDQPNQEVLTTLQKLTGQNYGFDERTWRLWWAAEKSHGAGGAPVLKNNN
ncbi:MAG: hypothetical protein JWP89_4345 [Schlesneria sp.]|nr:hypothetical protein [Schlesneria sp.]